MFKLYKDYKKYKRVARKVYIVAGFLGAYRYSKNIASFYPDSNYIPFDLAMSFDWRDTSEGYDYWTDIADKLERLR